ncbi:alkene reductase [Sorangium sp. So ce341]|uniref:alkene reductase n=1 Tax=Sorangium sp. So ce341 TaxID=3133302 RepID=UPI003F5EF58A
MATVLSPLTLGRIELANRLVMAPMTRARARDDGSPGELAAEYYAQRASVGLIITEGTQPSDDGQGYPATPGIYTDAHVHGWRKVTDAVHARGGHIFFQLMHAGRMSHPDNTPHHRPGVAPSAIAPGAQIFTMTGLKDIPTPRALSTQEIRQTIADYRHAARRAIDAGADGVEIHGIAYLVHQFLAASSNVRTDDYGGSLESRARFAIEVARAITAEIGADRTGIRLSPGFSSWGLDHGAERLELYRYLVGELDKVGLAYLHIVHYGAEDILHALREVWSRALILNRPERVREDIGKDIASGLADLESYGQFTLANPDFVARLRSGAPLSKADAGTYFGSRAGSPAVGYTDYPAMATG